MTTIEKLAAVDATISTSGMDAKQIEKLSRKGFESGSLPANGVFSDEIRVSGDGIFKHLRIDALDEKGVIVGGIAINSAKAMAYFSTKASAKFEPYTGKNTDFIGAKVLKGTKSVNSQFSRFSTRELAAELMGMKFSTKMVSGFILPYVTDDNGVMVKWIEPTSNDLESKDYYQITLL